MCIAGLLSLHTSDMDAAGLRACCAVYVHVHALAKGRWACTPAVVRPGLVS